MERRQVEEEVSVEVHLHNTVAVIAEKTLENVPHVSKTHPMVDEGVHVEVPQVEK